MPPDPAWYPDPEAPGGLRWWDGTAWTDHRAAPSAGAPFMGAPAARPGRKVWPWVAGAVALSLVLAGVTGAIVISRIVNSVTAPVDAANEYLRGAKAGGTLDSFQRLCEEIRAQHTYSEYRQELAARRAQRGQLLSYDAHGTHRSFGSSQASVDIRIVTSHGTSEIRASMNKEGGHWRWCGYGPAPGFGFRELPLI